MLSIWLKPVLVCLAAGLVWGFYKEFADLRRGALRYAPRPFKPHRAVLLGLAGAAACFLGLVILTWLGLTEIGLG